MHLSRYVIGLCTLLAPLQAQYSQNMEALTASAAGTIITGQDGFYVPVAGSLDGKVYTYAGNTIGVPANPNGGNNFYAGVSTGGLARAQRAITFPTGLLRIEYDVLVKYVGTGTPNQYPGGVSLQPSTTSRYINMLCSWNLTTPTLTWNGLVQSGAALVPVGDPAFVGLAANVWHRWGATIDLTNQAYVSFSITNGSTNVTTHFVPPTSMPIGGVGLPLPTDFRLFTGGTDNLSAMDNLIIDVGASYTPFGNGCAGSAGVPSLAAAAGSRPALGTTFQAVLGNLPQGLAVITSGFSNTLALGSVPLPFDLTGTGFPGCFLLVDPLISEFLIGAGNSATWNFPIPLVPAFAGIQLYQQGISLDPVAPGAAFSNGTAMVIGY